MRSNAQRYLARLDACRAGGPTCNYDESEIAGLPAPVNRYFRAVLRNRQPIVETTRVSHAGEFRTGERSTGWRPFWSTEVFTVRPPGFVWDAYIRMAPGLRVHVLDTYIAGSASMCAKLFGFIPIADARDTSELAAGALQRYLAEAAWFPTALLPSQGVQWQAIDESKALATLTDGATSVSLEFQFNPEGEITGAFTPSRGREVKGAYKPTPWACRYTNYADRENMRIPLEGEVEWQLPDGPLPYWRGRVTSIGYEYALPAGARLHPDRSQSGGI